MYLNPERLGALAIALCAPLCTLHPRAAAQTDTGGVEVAPVTELPPVNVRLLGPAAIAAPAATSRVIDIAICLDTSGSMRGLIDSARQKIWTIVNDLALAKPEPQLRVALLAYGGQSYPQEAGFVRLAAPLTSDLDLISRELFTLSAGGSVEYVGRVVDRATQLAWSPEPGALKLIVVAGNESADQDRVRPYRDACRSAIARDIMVNAIYCGPGTDAIAPGWREIAKLADGQFASIDKDNGTVAIASPYDAELTRLSGEINTTYLYYGEGGRGAWANQTVQDRNAAELNSDAQASRAQLKSGKFYRNSHWDLVDATKEESFDLAGVDPAHLPEVMRLMTLEQRKGYIAAMRKKRTGIQAQIAKLSESRSKFVEEAMLEHDETKALDFVIRKALRDQARTRGFTFESKRSEGTVEKATPEGTQEAPQETTQEPRRQGRR
ncbi:MAG: VWA domain-containing protein [bacterium]|nr:VWA domain-containing protein [bacterium]